VNKKLTVVCCLLVALLGLFMALPTKAASLQLVTNNWGTNGMPTNLSMYVYVPDNVVTNPPILVLLHYWGGGAGGVFAEAQAGGIVAASDRNGFIMVVPQRSADCWDAGSAQSLTHDGGGETQGIARMVRYAITNYQANADRVYVTGTSCGAMMTEALLAVYPDIFKAGSAFAGQAVGGAWTPVTHTAQEWGNIVRAAYPGYSGSRPRVQLWHGMADGIINYSNQTEAIMQWTDVLGLSANPTFSTTVTLYNHQWLRQIWQDSLGATALDAWSEYNGPHGTDANLNALYVMPFLNLDEVNLPYPWMSQDVGTAGVAGSATGSNGVFSVTGSGADIWNTADAFRFVYVPVNGNCSIVTHVTSVQNIDPWSKAGVMIRESLSANAANAFIAVTPSNGVAWQNRSTSGGVTGNSTTAGLSAPYWVKLVRSGNTFTGYRSADGTNWTQQGTATFTMASTAYVGLALTSHNNSTLCTATFDNVTAPGWLISQGLVPAGLSATSVSASQINLVWNTLTNATSYNVKRSTTNGGPFVIITSGVTSTNYLDSGLAGGTILYYVVSAVSSGSETPDSAEASAATLSPTLGPLVHRYSFSETSGASVADSVGGPVWTGTLPNGGTFSSGQLTLASASSQYANLPAGIVGSLSNFTIVAWVRLNSTTNWNRVFDFGSSTAVNMFLTPQNGFDGRVRFAITTSGGGGEQQVNCASTMSAGVWYQVAVTLNGNRGVLYLNGLPVGTNNAMTLRPSSLGSTANNYIGRSQYPDPYLNGLIDEFRIYNIGLSAAEIAATAALGPSQLLSTNSPEMRMAILGTNLTISWPLASAGYTLQWRTDLVQGGWVNVTSVAPQIVGNLWQMALPQSTNSSAFYRLAK
jgi:poly(hydroxyalkanoate) depolymerase family esterase